MNFIRDFIRKIGELSEESEEEFLSLLEYKEFKKGEIIAKKGEIPTNFFMLKSGIARSYFTDENDDTDITYEPSITTEEVYGQFEGSEETNSENGKTGN